MIAFCFSRFVRKIRSLQSSRTTGLFVGIPSTSRSVDLVELVLFGLRRTGHARELIVHAGAVLDGDGGERLRLALDLDTYLCFSTDRRRSSLQLRPAIGRPLSSSTITTCRALTDDVLLVVVEERANLQEPTDDVEFLARGRVLGLESLDLLATQTL